MSAADVLQIDAFRSSGGGFVKVNRYLQLGPDFGRDARSALTQGGNVAGSMPRFYADVIARLIAGISLVDAMVLAASGAEAPIIGLALLAFGMTLLLQRYVEGT